MIAKFLFMDIFDFFLLFGLFFTLKAYVILIFRLNADGSRRGTGGACTLQGGMIKD